ncbi:ATPase [Pseudomonas sp. MAP12]|uniref:ATPase n=1 Tax=Geopseudomonas aromaticivorans TaxID=2849492 RepID=A0ABS6MZW6_9GAMM|nr:ATPase [Pseudomonas aromaticivorans]MBV2134363.1 ATPase [Pseudomonas aromaticivorans]
MRNDSLDELDDLPSLKTDDREPAFSADAPPPRSRAMPAPAAARTASARPLWALVGVLLLALAGLGWWSQQRLEQMAQQLVATQESFARISEDAAGRLKDISGKVVATESSVTSESEALKLRIKQLETKLAQLGKQQQAAAAQQETQVQQLAQLRAELKTQQAGTLQLAAALKEQQAGVAVVEGRLKDLGDEQAALKTAQGALGKLESRLESLGSEVVALKKQGNPAQAIGRLESDMLVLRSQLDNRPAAAAGSAELDAFRAQMTRNITTLQAQVQNLQQQLDAR